MKTVYGVKFLQNTFASPYQEFDYGPYMPKGAKPGKWLPPVKGKLTYCANGYHAARLTRESIYAWQVTDVAVLVELREPLEEVDTKYCARRMRILEVLSTSAWALSPTTLLRKAEKALRRMGVEDVV